MKLITPIIAIVVLLTGAACSKEEPKEPPAPKAEESGITGIVRTQNGRIESGRQTMEDAKQINQTLLDSAAEQRETIEKTQQ
ncbi:MAG: hypothetical protein Q8Q54_13085 [Methylococcales bacterium]|nr:hypothetical protein [Methylococcales bacterium]